MIRLATFDFVMTIFRARMMDEAFDLELARMHAGDRATYAPRLRSAGTVADRQLGHRPTDDLR